jgi:hypothetical protein
VIKLPLEFETAKRYLRDDPNSPYAQTVMAAHAYERAIENLLHLEQWPPPHELIGYLWRCAEKILADLLKEAK